MYQFLPQLLLFLVLFGANLYLMCNISVGLDQELALPKVSLTFSQPFVQRPGMGIGAQQVERWWWWNLRGGHNTRLGTMQSCSKWALREKPHPCL